LSAVYAKILYIHLKNPEIEPKSFDLVQLMKAVDGFSGAGIEQGLVSAMYAANALRLTASLFRM
jgi:hypothetical protein